MRYKEQIKSSWSYNWGIFRDVWDMFTLHNWYWLVFSLLVVLCIISQVGSLLSFTTHYYIITPVPTFAPSLSQELAITDYLSQAMPAPSIPMVINYYWIRGSGFGLLTNTLCLVSGGLLLIAYLRGK